MEAFTLRGDKAGVPNIYLMCMAAFFNEQEDWNGEVEATGELAKNLINRFKGVNGYSWKEKLDACSNCKCCVRHQYNKPKKLEKWMEVIEDEGYCIPPWLDKTCKCDCRHIARFICRQCDEDGNWPDCPIDPSEHEEPA